ncbi:MAG: lactaldehyde reductase [Synergistaceae bacterium]|nr:lactaldehyde reductase [Synergistaceae bacterium]
MANRMVFNGTGYFGSGAISAIPTEVRARGFKKALVVTDPDLIKAGVAEKVLAILKAEHIACEIYSDLKQNPTIENIKGGVEAYKSAHADFMIAIGGGSAIDTAKGVGIIINNPEYADVRSLEGVAPTKYPSVPVFAVPTTAGTAAETTINYVVTDVEKKRKFVCVDPHDIPVVAFVDADMMASMPKALAAATGMDALTHAIEGYITRGAWAMSDMFHIKSIEIIAANLRAAVNEKCPAAMEAMSYGQYIAGMGYSNVGLGLVHGMSHPMGAVFDTPHGVANALLLPYVMEFNASAVGEKYRDIAKAMGVKGTCEMTEEQYKKAAVDAVKKLSEDVGIPKRLRDVGVTEDKLVQISKDAAADVCTPGNPRSVTEAEILELYKSAF